MIAPLAHGDATCDSVATQHQGAAWKAGMFATLRVVVAGCVELAVFYALPLDNEHFSPLVLAAIAIPALGAILALQSMAIARSPMPRLRAIEALAASLPLLLLIFASAYVMLTTETASSFTQPLGHSDAIYFTTTVFSTVGFGDITPVSHSARLLVTAQMLVDLLVLGVGVKVITGAVTLGEERHDTGAPLSEAP